MQSHNRKKHTHTHTNCVIMGWKTYGCVMCALIFRICIHQNDCAQCLEFICFKHDDTVCVCVCIVYGSKFMRKNVLHECALIQCEFIEYYQLKLAQINTCITQTHTENCMRFCSIASTSSPHRFGLDVVLFHAHSLFDFSSMKNFPES